MVTSTLNSTIQLGLVEDQADTIAMIVESVGLDSSVTIQFVAQSVAAAKNALLTCRPDILLVDLGLPDGSGLEVIDMAVRISPQTDVLVFSMFGDEHSVINSILLGACGYVLKDSPGLSLADSIATLRAGGAPMSPIIARRILGLVRTAEARTRADARNSATMRLTVSTQTKVAASAALAHAGVSSQGGHSLESENGAPVHGRSTQAERAPPAGDEGTPKLTGREQQVLELVARGYSYAEVSDLMQVSLNTIRTHVRALYFKLSVHSGREAIFEANRLGLLRSTH